jgi:excisionase family DNA binding protein
MKSEHPGSPTVMSPLVSLREAALMMHICVRTVYRMIDEGELPKVVKVRSRSFLPLSAICAYLRKIGGPVEQQF